MLTETISSTGVREIPLTRGRVALVDEIDYERLSKHSWCISRKKNADYAVRGERIGGRSRTIYMHYEIMGDQPSGLSVDHINPCCTLDNRRRNLRIASNQQQACNKRAHSDNASGCKGVFWSKPSQKWQAQIMHCGVKIHLGTFAEKSDAASAYAAAAIKLHGSFARLA